MINSLKDNNIKAEGSETLTNLYAIRISMTIRAFRPVDNFAYMAGFIVRNPLQQIDSTLCRRRLVNLRIDRI
jgi:hypothetical protein